MVRRAALLALTALVVALLAGAGPLTAPAAAAGPSQVTLVGHGWGHGHGMGQYGAQGYGSGFATGTPWTSAQIVDHFYGGTTPGNVGNPDITVVLSPPGATTTTGYTGSMIVAAADAAHRPYIQNLNEGVARIPTGVAAVRITRLTATTTRVEYGAGCGGPWVSPATYGGTVTMHPADAQPESMLRLCTGAMTGSGSATRLYRGMLRTRVNASRQFTLNIVPLEAYLGGVVPLESPASWSAPALQAQAIAARSYALADARTRQGTYGFEATCDTISCQVYGGRSAEQPSTNNAIAATTGVVRLMPNGSVARTEFSSSTGGWTVPRDFTAVPDAGDAIPSNPNHDWSVTLTATQIAQAYGKLASDFLGIEVTGRNGLGDYGGRVTQVVIRFGSGNVTRTGNQFRSTFSGAGVKSDWFAVQTGGYDQATANYVTRTYQDFVARAPNQQELAGWSAAIASGQVGRLDLTRALSTSDEWAGKVITALYWKTLGRAPDAGSLSLWVAALRGGASVTEVSVGFYASDEFYGRVGGTPTSFVAALYSLILGRPPDQQGLAHWSALSTTQAGRIEVARGFFGSVESRRGRVIDLYRHFLCRDPDAAGLAGWAETLLTQDDLVLAATLATSAEYFQKAQLPKAC